MSRSIALPEIISSLSAAMARSWSSRFCVGKIAFELLHELAVGRIRKSALDRLVRHRVGGDRWRSRRFAVCALRRVLSATVCCRVGLSVGGSSLRADVAGDEIGLREGDKEFAVFGVFEGRGIRSLAPRWLACFSMPRYLPMPLWKWTTRSPGASSWNSAAGVW